MYGHDGVPANFVIGTAPWKASDGYSVGTPITRTQINVSPGGIRYLYYYRDIGPYAGNWTTSGMDPGRLDGPGYDSRRFYWEVGYNPASGNTVGWKITFGDGAVVERENGNGFPVISTVDLNGIDVMGSAIGNDNLYEVRVRLDGEEVFRTRVSDFNTFTYNFPENFSGDYIIDMVGIYLDGAMYPIDPYILAEGHINANDIPPPVVDPVDDINIDLDDNVQNVISYDADGNVDRQGYKSLTIEGNTATNSITSYSYNSGGMSYQSTGPGTNSVTADDVRLQTAILGGKLDTIAGKLGPVSPGPEASPTPEHSGEDVRDTLYPGLSSVAFPEALPSPADGGAAVLPSRDDNFWRLQFTVPGIDMSFDLDLFPLSHPALAALAAWVRLFLTYFATASLAWYIVGLAKQFSTEAALVPQVKVPDVEVEILGFGASLSSVIAVFLVGAILGVYVLFTTSLSSYLALFSSVPLLSDWLTLFGAGGAAGSSAALLQGLVLLDYFVPVVHILVVISNAFILRSSYAVIFRAFSMAWKAIWA